MIFTLTNDETGREFVFASEESYESANEWYNTTEKGPIVEFCKQHGLDLHEPTSDPFFNGIKLVDDWADAAMECYAANAK